LKSRWRRKGGRHDRPLPPVIAQLLPRLGSNFDGEIIATAKAIERVLHSSSMDWHDLTKAITAPPPIPWQSNRTESHESAEMRTWLEAISRETWPNDWTRSFIANILTRQSLDSLSVKQRTCAQNIITEAYRRGVRVDRRAA
jgi:predicted nuclease of predicted toxin-antitoxin system